MRESAHGESDGSTPIALAAAIANIECDYVRSRPDEDRWKENMYTLASRAENDTAVGNHTKEVHVWSLTVQAWRCLRGIKVCHIALLAAVGLCFVIAVVRVAGGAIVLAVILPIMYFSRNGEWGAYAAPEPHLPLPTPLTASDEVYGRPGGVHF